MPGALDHQPEGGAGFDYRQQHEACCEAAYQQVKSFSALVDKFLIMSNLGTTTSTATLVPAMTTC